MFETEAEKRTKNCQEAYNSGFNDGYAVGLKAGKDMNVDKWHDLSEDPNDLPKGCEAVLREEIMFEKKAEEYKLLHTHLTPGYYLTASKYKSYKMRDFTQEEKELILNTPINRVNCFDMSEFTDLYIDMEFGSIKEQWLQTVKMLEALRIRCLETRDEELFIEFIRMLPNSYKVVKL